MFDLESLFSLVVCLGVPALGAVAAIVAITTALIRPRGGGEIERRVGDLEATIAALVAENATFATRLSRLERTRRTAASTPSGLDTNAIAEVAANAGADANANARVDENPAADANAITNVDANETASANAITNAEVPANAIADAAITHAAGDASANADMRSGAVASLRAMAAVGAGAAAPAAGAGAAAPAVVAASTSSSAPTDAAGAPAPATPPRRAGDGGGDGHSEGDGWERWIGVRGAAALGAIVLVIAGLYLFQYSIEHGWLGPGVRVVLGAIVGIACLVSSETTLRLRFPALAPWIAGAGVAILYLTSWAASALYHLVPIAASGVLMVAVTITCGALAIRRSSLPIALLGLSGGFLTPIALSTGEDRPIPLFAYLLLLDAGLLLIAHQRRWPALGLVALGATALYELLWIFGRMEGDAIVIGTLVVLAFAALFVLFPAPRSEDGARREANTPLRIGALLFPFLLVIGFARGTHGEMGIAATAILLLALTVASSIVARRDGIPIVALFGAGGALAVLLIGMLQWPLATPTAALGPLAIAIAIVLHVAAEIDRGERPEITLAAAAGSIGVSGVLTVVALLAPIAWWAFLGALAIAVLLALRLAAIGPRIPIAIIAGITAPIATAAIAAAAPESVASALLVAVFPAQALLFSAASALGRDLSVRRALDVGGVIAALEGALLVAITQPSSASIAALAAIAICAALALLAAAREGGAIFAVAAVLVAAVAQLRFALTDLPDWTDAPRLAIVAATTIALAAWPAIAPRLASLSWGWRASALAPPLAFLSLRALWLEVFGPAYIGALAVIGALLALGLAFLASRRAGDHGARRVAIVWLAAAAAGFVTAAIPLQLENEWWTIGWALEAAALLALHRRLDHPGLKYLAVAIFGAVILRLVANPYVLGYAPRSELPILNWLSYTYLVPAMALALGSRLLADVEVARRRRWEDAIVLWPKPYLASALFSAALIVVFVWINLSIFDVFGSGRELTIPFDRMPARDLTLSIAWAIYALVLLAIGMARDSMALRIASLGLLLVTAGKVFLYDLGHLRDLYRVGALAGLALSLILVSLAYQRFVFRRTATEAA